MEAEEDCSNFPVIDFGSPEVVMGDLHEVPLKASGKRQITLCAIVVAVIYIQRATYHLPA